ncbi:hypothetical protein NFI96_033000, partial [Prochilodus magdalenae]
RAPLTLFTHKVGDAIGDYTCGDMTRPCERGFDKHVIETGRGSSLERIWPLGDLFGVLPHEVVLAEDEQRAVDGEAVLPDRYWVVQGHGPGALGHGLFVDPVRSRRASLPSGATSTDAAAPGTTLRVPVAMSVPVPVRVRMRAAAPGAAVAGRHLVREARHSEQCTRGGQAKMKKKKKEEKEEEKKKKKEAPPRHHNHITFPHGVPVVIFALALLTRCPSSRENEEEEEYKEVVDDEEVYEEVEDAEVVWRGLESEGPSRFLYGFGITAVRGHVEVRENFITEEEENALLQELEPGLKKKRYEFDHWDDAIHGYRETERLQWGSACAALLSRVRAVAFPEGSPLLGPVHVLDLDKAGYIKPHVDSVKFCGSTIAGLSLLSDSVMRLVREENSADWVDLLLSRRSLYIVRDEARFKFTHEILKDEESFFSGQRVPRLRRISVICRNLPV